jgi:hypothetical protein
MFGHFERYLNRYLSADGGNYGKIIESEVMRYD